MGHRGGYTPSSAQATAGHVPLLHGVRWLGLQDRALDWLQLVEDEGQWPGFLTKGYTSLISKPGEEGPLGTRPLRVLSMVYWLWAGTRLRDVLLWQEAWAHPEAYGFRPCRGAIDRAGVTAVLLELARLKGWNLAGLSLDYVKCFDIIPQAVVLRLARELGMDRVTLRALAAMYRQLRRAFRLAGSLGEWWRATNGILQGCPLSVVLINLLTSIWKMEIDDMRKHVVVATRQLPPRNVGPPLLGMPSALEPQGAGVAAVCPKVRQHLSGPLWGDRSIRGLDGCNRVLVVVSDPVVWAKDRAPTVRQRP